MSMMQRLFFLLLALFVVPVMAADNTQFGDWNKTCENDTEAGKPFCYIVQTATNNKDGKVVMQVQIGYAPNKPDPLIVTTVPIGVLIPQGAGLILKEGQLKRLPYLLCNQKGCMTVGQPLTQAEVTMMKKGISAELRVITSSQKVLALPISLKGFTKAFSSLNK